MSEPKYLQAELHIDGMTCASCELLLERKLKAVPGVHRVDVNHARGVASITAQAGKLPDEERLASVIRKAGYSLAEDGAASAAPDGRKWAEIGGSLLIIFAIYRLLETFDILSLAPSTSGPVSLGGVLVIGLVAGTSSCLAVTGGLLLALAAKHNQIRAAETPLQKFMPLLKFNAGRLASYFVLGGLVGILGQSISFSSKFSGYLSIGVSLAMLWLALTILELIPKGSFPIRPPKRLSRWVAGLSESSHPLAPYALGAMTFFLPCGFTQSLQLVALASGNFLSGGLVMFVFALGTLPSLLGLSAISSAATGSASRLFLRFSGTLVFVLALINFGSGVALTGIALPTLARGVPAAAQAAPQAVGGVQEVSMKVTRAGYEPSTLTIQSGVPVRWHVDGTSAIGCTSQLVIPDLGIRKALGPGDNIIDFTAPNPGRLAFSCSMGMVRGSFTVL